MKLTPTVPITLMSLLVTSVVTVLLAGVGPAAQAAPACGGRAPTIVGTAGDDRLKGTDGPDVIAGLAGDDVIRGLDGNDRLCGGDGRDRIKGGDGNDRLFGGRDRAIPNEQNSHYSDLFGDRVIGGRGDDLLDPGFDTRPSLSRDPDVISFEDAKDGINLHIALGRATGQGVDRLVTRGAEFVTSRFADVVIGTARNDYISTGDGDDVIRARGGRDTVFADGPKLIGRGGDDIVRLGAGADYSVSGKGDDTVVGGSGGDIITDNGRRSADVLKGGLDRDSIEDKLAENGEQRLVGGPASDDAKDTLTLNRVGSALQPGAWDMTTGTLTVGASPTVASVVLHFRETILPKGIAWVIEGSERSERVLVFDGGADITYAGNGGNDSFFGARGDDTFDGGAGVDYAIDMGKGQDTCIGVEQFGAGIEPLRDQDLSP